MPGDDGLHQCVGASSRRDGHGIVGQQREGASEVFLVDIAQGLDEGVVLTVARGTSLVLLAVDFHLDIGTGLQTVGRGNHVTDEFHAVFGGVVFQHVTDDEGQVFGCHHLLAVAEFGDALGDEAGLLGRQFQSQVLQVAQDIRLSAVLAQRILAPTAEAFGHELVHVESALVVAVGMHTGHLRKHVLTDDGLIGSHGDAAVTLHQARHIVEFVLLDAGLGMEMVFQDDLHTAERCISATLAESVHGDVQSATATQHGGKRIAHGQVVVVVRMEIEVRAGIAFLHLAHKFDDLQGIQHAEGVGEHKTLYLLVHQGIEQMIDVVGRVLHAVAPVL